MIAGVDNTRKHCQMSTAYQIWPANCVIICWQRHLVSKTKMKTKTKTHRKLCLEQWTREQESKLQQPSTYTIINDQRSLSKWTVRFYLFGQFALGRSCANRAAGRDKFNLMIRNYCTLIALAKATAKAAAAAAAIAATATKWKID